MSRTLLFEIGVEEIPSAPLYAAIVELKATAEKAFDDQRIGYDTLETYGSPRRLVLRVTDVVDRQEDRTLRHKGPAAKSAFDDSGAPTKAAEGFARGKGISVADLVRETDENGGEYVFAIIEECGKAVEEVLPALLQRLIEGLSWPKSQRWGSGSARFIRPVRWIVALLGEELIPVGFAGCTSDRHTFGHRFLGASGVPIPVASADEYDHAAKHGMFVYDQAERARIIREGIAAIEAQQNVRVVVPEKTFAEVVNLVEWPTVVVGHFDESFLDVPREIIETAMTKHQRYFPVESVDGALTNAFLVVHNGDPARADAIVAGHERVIRARLADASFFVQEDRKESMEDWVHRLESITFHEKLGSLGAKVMRIEALTRRLADQHGADEAEKAEALRGAHLAKADLVSHAVVEFPVLQGVMGYHYALGAGEREAVALAIREHYLPRFAGDARPSTTPGAIVSAADKLDTICGMFAIDQAPTGAADPYALRRSAIGVLGMIMDDSVSVFLTEAIAAALQGYVDSLPALDVERVGDSVHAFLVGRLEGMLRDKGHAFDTVAAVLAVSSDSPLDALARCEVLTEMRVAGDDMRDLSVAFTRARNLSKPELGTSADRALMGAAEVTLASALDRSEAAAIAAIDEGDYTSALGILASLRGPIDAFFDAVLVMDPDERLRDNRLRLLNRFAALFARYADFSRIEG